MGTVAFLLKQEDNYWVCKELLCEKRIVRFAQFTFLCGR